MVIPLVVTVRNIAVIAHDGLWEHTPLTLLTLLTFFTLLTLFKQLTLLALALCINTPSYFNCLDHQELENIAHNGHGSLMEIERVGWDETD